MNATIEVPQDGTWFEGHFPGRPILPGVAELALAADALGQAGSPLSLQGIAFARLRQIVHPGDRLELVARQQDAAHLRFDLRRDGMLVANAEFIVGTPQASGGETGAAETIAGVASVRQASAFPPLDALLPHRPPMRFVTAILHEEADGLTCAARIPGLCALVAGGSAQPVAAIEAAAQAAAAWEALRRSRHAGAAGPRIGYLVALRDVVFFTGSVAAERDLLVSVRLEAAAPPLTHYRIAVSLDGEAVTRGTIATFLADDNA
jgi:3-hydroxymyristoyl/3-hydroxydecanoyl-(acyl carrier protein) dehydratase